MNGKLGALARSRRFWSAGAALAAVVLNELLGLSAAEVELVVMTLGAWIVGDSLRRTD